MSIYYNPKDASLEIVGSVEREPNYDFDMLVVWKNAKGELFYGKDSGCSCPSPFEDFHSEADLTRISHDSKDQFEKEVMGFDCPLEERTALIDRVRALSGGEDGKL